MSKQILITNDDGIGADGIRKLAEIAREFGEVTVIAPDAQRSAASHHCIFNRPLILKEYDFGANGIQAYTLDGMPADCARVGILAVMDHKPDVVLSGINHGYNISSDIQYSGTVGAALEAAFLGVHAIVVSYGNSAFDATDIVDRYLPGLLDEYIEKPLPANRIWNINIPDCPADECRGIVRDAAMNTDYFYDDQYVKEKTSEKTWSSIEQFVSNSIEILSFDEMEPFTKHASDIRLADIGRERTVVFVNVSDNRRSMDMMVNIFYTQLFQALMNEADSHEDGKLEVPVRIVLDDFANNVFIPDFDKIISTIRSRQISTSIILQDLSQLEGMYKKAHARTIMSNCDHKIFIGGQDDAETADYVADIAGCLPESVKNLELGKAWIVERGGKPRLCDVVEPYSMDILLKE